MPKIIYTSDAEMELWSLLGLFESNKYVSDRLMKRYPSISDNEVEFRTEQIVYSVRQAREFYNSSENVTLLTSPLLLSYGMLNLAKALVNYLSSEGTNFKDFFKSHGLKVPYSNSELSLSNEKVKFKSSGTYCELANILEENIYINEEMNLKDILSQIPDLRELYILTYNEAPRTTPLRKNEHGYSMQDLGDFYSEVWRQIEENAEIYQDSGYFIEGGQNNIYITKSIAATKALEKYSIMLKSLTGIEYFRTIPKLNNQLIILKEISLHYLIIFTYGMLARYQAVRWGKYIDKNLSNEAEIINKSIFVSKNRFLHLVINYLLEEELQFNSSIEQIEKSRREMADYVYNDVMKKMNNDLKRQIRSFSSPY